jgi:Icc-related predicted phosphoesterase
MDEECAGLRVLATADFHGNAEAFHKTSQKARAVSADLVIVCGDVTHFGLLQQARDLLSHLQDIEMPTFFVPGNCDLPILADEKMGNVESIHGRCRVIGDFNFIGVGGSPPSPFNTPFELNEVEIASVLEKAYTSCQIQLRTIVVSHSPPRDTKVDIAFTGEHVGSQTVREFIQRKRPELLLCGHIHEAKGMDRIGETLIVNLGPARHGNCATIDLDKVADVKFDFL